nr:SRPBCC family protein [Thauera sp.]
RYNAEGMTYSYKITEVDVKVLPVSNYTSHLTVSADGEGKSKVQWRGAFYRGFPNNDPPPELSDQAAIDAVTGVYKGGLDALKAEMEK